MKNTREWLHVAILLGAIAGVAANPSMSALAQGAATDASGGIVDAPDAVTTKEQASTYLSTMKTFGDRYQTCVPELLKSVGKNDANPATVERLKTDAAKLVKEMQGVVPPKEMAAGHASLMSIMSMVGKLAGGKQDPFAAMAQAYELLQKTQAGTGKFDAAAKQFMETQGIKGASESAGSLFARETNTTQSATGAMNNP